MKATIKTLSDLDVNHSIPHAAMQRVNHAVKILLAVENLIKQKGRYNTEIAYNALVIAVDQMPAATPDCNTLEIISASQSLIDKLHLIILSAEYKSVFVLAGNRGMPYAGPNFELEMNALEMALKA